MLSRTTGCNGLRRQQGWLIRRIVTLRGVLLPLCGTGKAQLMQVISYMCIHLLGTQPELSFCWSTALQKSWPRELILILPDVLFFKQAVLLIRQTFGFKHSTFYSVTCTHSLSLAHECIIYCLCLHGTQRVNHGPSCHLKHKGCTHHLVALCVQWVHGSICALREFWISSLETK